MIDQVMVDLVVNLVTGLLRKMCFNFSFNRIKAHGCQIFVGIWY